MQQNLWASYRLTRLNEHFGNSFVATALGAMLNPNVQLTSVFPVILTINILLGIFSFAINDIEDAQDDALDPKKAKRNPISAKDLGVPQAWILTGSSALLALVLAWLIGPIVFLITLMTVVLGFLYSYKGFRLKSMPIVDVISHGLFLGTLPFLNSALARGGQVTWLVALLSLLIFLTSVIGDIDNEIRDYVVDRQQKIRNTASLVDLRPLAPFVHFIHAGLAIAIMLVIVKNLSIPGIAFLVVVGLVIAGRYLLTPTNERNKFYYRYSQILLVGVGVILLTDKWLRFFIS